MWGGTVSISGTRAAFKEVQTGIFMGTVPIWPPVLTSLTRTQEQVETAFTWRSDGFSPEPTGSVLNSHRPREFWELTQSDTCMNSEFIGWIYDSVILRIRWSWVGLSRLYECVPYRAVYLVVSGWFSRNRRIHWEIESVLIWEKKIRPVISHWFTNDFGQRSARVTVYTRL